MPTVRPSSVRALRRRKVVELRLRGFYLPVERLSATSLAEAITCPEQFRMKRVARMPERNNIQKLMGTAFHEAVADSYRWRLEKGELLPKSATEDRFRGAWDEAIEKEGEPEWKEHPDKLMETGFKMLSAYRSVMKATEVTQAEEWFEITVPGIPVPVVGVIDLPLKDRIREVKTSAKKMSKPKPTWRLQARIYQLAIAKPVEHQVVTKQVTPQVCTADTEPGLMTPIQNKDATVLLLQQAVALVNDLYARYGADQPWPANGIFHDWLCNYCSFRPNCFAWKENNDQAADRVA